ncbi:hypothetical protein BC943DRAFT_334131 [Umbelopsis sp. AD052]|nr:hypothetical protein BC943DRAFT_334131 [Umbelopsis sp. AD052]
MVFLRSLASLLLISSLGLQVLAASTTTKSTTTKSSTKTTTTKISTKTTTTKTSTKTTTTKTSTRTSSTAAPTSTSSRGSWSWPNWNSYSDSTDAQWQAAWNITNWSYPHTSGENHNIVANPTDSSEKVLRVFYPAGSYKPSSTPVGGIGFYASPLNIPANANTVTFTYQVYFSSGYNFVQGGKLPGLYGGHDDCSGGNDAETCFSTRNMWRTSGQGESYLYIPKDAQVSSICSNSLVICNSDYGYSVGRGTFDWNTGSWNTITQVLQLNTVGQQDGAITEIHGSSTAYNLGQLVFRQSNYGVAGIDFETFFGGSTSAWATPTDQYTYYRGLSLSYN